MTRREASIISAYTGILIGDFTDMHKYIEEKLGRPVFAHELEDKSVVEEIKKESEEDFFKIYNTGDRNMTAQEMFEELGMEFYSKNHWLYDFLDERKTYVYFNLKKKSIECEVCVDDFKNKDDIKLFNEAIHQQTKELGWLDEAREPILLADEGFDIDVSSHLCCPCCKKPIEIVWSNIEYKPRYCHYCGQELNWG